jgi:MFS family permease
VIRVLSNSWALLLGMTLIMLGNGLQTSLLGIRASLENFSTTITGLMMSGYFLGLILGCHITPISVNRVGHIRMFGALASLASTSILLQAIFIDPFIWWFMRIVTGFSYAGLYIVAESWLNESATNRTRGKLFSLYMLISFGGMAGGQMMLNLSPPSGFELFLLASLLISLAVIPILVSVSKAPQFEVMEKVNIIQLYRVSPLGVVGMVVSGMAIGAIYAMGPVFATDTGMSVKDVSFFMTVIILGGFLFQYPLGWLSDIVGRRKVILLSCFSGAGVSIFASSLFVDDMFFFFIIACVGGLSLPLYSLCGVHINDYLNPTQMVAASGSLVLLSSIGATFGASLTAAAMDVFGSNAFYGSIAIMLASVFIFSLWRNAKRPEPVGEKTGDFIVMPPSPLTVSLNPDVSLNEIEMAAQKEAQTIQSSFDKLLDDLEN